MTLSGVRQFARSVTIGLLVASLGAYSPLPAQTRPVSPAELHKEVVAATRARHYHRDTINGFLSSSKAQKVFRAAHIDVDQVKAAVSSLNDEDLARLAARSANAQADFAAGRLSDRDLLIILLGFVALILIIVAVR